MAEQAENLTYSSPDWRKVADTLHQGAGPEAHHPYPPDMRPYAEYLDEKARSIDRLPAAKRPADGRFTETLTPRDAGYVRRAGREAGATELPGEDR